MSKPAEHTWIKLAQFVQQHPTFYAGTQYTHPIHTTLQNYCTFKQRESAKAKIECTAPRQVLLPKIDLQRRQQKMTLFNITSVYTSKNLNRSQRQAKPTTPAIPNVHPFLFWSGVLCRSRLHSNSSFLIGAACGFHCLRGFSFSNSLNNFARHLLSCWLACLLFKLLPHTVTTPQTWTRIHSRSQTS